MTAMSSDLIEHLESHLGAIDGGWSETADGVPLRAKVVRFRDVPGRGLTTFATLGLSDQVGTLPSGRTLRQELVVVGSQRDEERVPGLLGAVVAQLESQERAVARGEVLGPAGPLFPESELTALYAATPMLFADTFRVWHGSIPPTVIVLLIPITGDETNFIAAHGWEEFERLLEETDADVFDLRRGTTLTS